MTQHEHEAEHVEVYDNPDANRQYEQRGSNTVAMYAAPESAIPTSHYADPVATVVSRPQDLIRWGPIIAGIFAALGTLLTLTLLGLAVGLSLFNYNEPAATYGIGAGIWSAVTLLLSFFFGGLIAARGAAYDGRASGVLNGAMVWFVVVALLIYLFGSGVGSLTRLSASLASTAAQVAAPAAGQAVNDPALQAAAQAQALDAAQQAQATAQALMNQITPQDVTQAAGTAASAAWGALLSLGLAALAAISGGLLGARARRPTVTRTE